MPHLSEYHRPANLATALRLLARPTPRTVPLAGGAWLVARRDPSIQAVVDLSGLNLAFVRKSARRMRLGAMTTLQTLVAHPFVRELAGGLLAEAARRSAVLAIRNIATLGGTLVVGDATSAVLLALLALEGRVVIRSPIGREVGLAAFLADRPAYLPPQALVTEVYLPTPPARAGAALAEISRMPADRPIVNAAAVLQRVGHICRSACLALGGVAPRPIRLPEVEALVTSQRIDDALLAQAAEAVAASVHPLSDARASAEYRREMASVAAVRALRQAWEQAKG